LNSEKDMKKSVVIVGLIIFPYMPYMLVVINVTVRTYTCELLARKIGTRGHKWSVVHAWSDGFSAQEGPKEVRRN